MDDRFQDALDGLTQMHAAIDAALRAPTDPEPIRDTLQRVEMLVRELLDDVKRHNGSADAH